MKAVRSYPSVAGSKIIVISTMVENPAAPTIHFLFRKISKESILLLHLVKRIAD